MIIALSHTWAERKRNPALLGGTKLEDLVRHVNTIYGAVDQTHCTTGRHDSVYMSIWRRWQMAAAPDPLDYLLWKASSNYFIE